MEPEVRAPSPLDQSLVLCVRVRVCVCVCVYVYMCVCVYVVHRQVANGSVMRNVGESTDTYD